MGEQVDVQFVGPQRFTLRDVTGRTVSEVHTHTHTHTQRMPCTRTKNVVDKAAGVHLV